jgi:two-component system response regulator AtoC
MNRAEIQKIEKAGALVKFPDSKSEPKINASTNRIRVLVADDEKDLLEIYTRVLTESGFEVFVASTGNEAVTRFIESWPEVIVLDYRMPRGNGLEAAAEILAMKPSAKIIMLTADGTVLEEAEKIGVELFLEKPISLQTLTKSVGTVLSLKSTSAIINR